MNEYSIRYWNDRTYADACARSEPEVVTEDQLKAIVGGPIEQTDLDAMQVGDKWESMFIRSIGDTSYYIDLVRVK